MVYLRYNRLQDMGAVSRFGKECLTLSVERIRTSLIAVNVKYIIYISAAQFKYLQGFKQNELYSL